MKSFPLYLDAYNHAAQLATTCKRDAGIYKAREFGRTVFNVSLLPDPKNRTGHELTAEIVTPNSPAMHSL